MPIGAFLLFGLWHVLSGYTDVFFLLCAVFSSILSVSFYRKDSVCRDIKVSKFIFYCLWITKESLFSAVSMLRKVWMVKPLPKSHFIKINKISNQENFAATGLLFYSITFTPGTISVNPSVDLVNCYDNEVAGDLLTGKIMRKIDDCFS